VTSAFGTWEQHRQRSTDGKKPQSTLPRCMPSSSCGNNTVGLIVHGLRLYKTSSKQHIEIKENGHCSHTCTFWNCRVAARPWNLAILYAICRMKRRLIHHSATRHLVRPQRLENHRGTLRSTPNYHQVQLPPTRNLDRGCVESRVIFRGVIAPEKFPKDIGRARTSQTT
jgi:hypothetical protein